MTRPLARLLTQDLYDLVAANETDYDALHAIYAETLFRSRQPARDLRAALGERLARLQEYFSWPTTDAGPGTGSLDDGAYQYAKGLLGYVGYRVGAQGASVDQRRALLDDVYLLRLPRVNSEVYMAEWDSPSSARRLQKLAESIASFARAAKRNDRYRYATAIAEWESDLRYLKTTYYDTRFGFQWPSTEA